MTTKPVEILVIGGGITGAGIARDAAMRGLKVALIDKNDFGYGTSSRSSKLIHGGLRYLEHFKFGLVFESTAERAILQRIAAHLVQPLPFIYPLYKGGKVGYWMMKAAMVLYDTLAVMRNYRSHKMLSPKEIKQLEKGLGRPHLRGGALYYDCMTDDARLTLETTRSAAWHGAQVANYVAVCGPIEGQHGNYTVPIKDMLSGEESSINAQSVINATGPWSDHVRLYSDNRRKPKIRTTKGIHLVVPAYRLRVSHAVVMHAVEDQRVLFAIPWGDFTYIGTTDTDYEGDPDAVHATRADVSYLLDTVNAHFPDSGLKECDIISTWAGLRPLIDDEQVRKASDVSREHEIFFESNGVLNIAGGKLTTYRSMAIQALKALAPTLTGRARQNIGNPCRTADYTLLGEPVENVVSDKLTGTNLDSDILIHLMQNYGKVADELIRQTGKNERSATRLMNGLPFIEAEIEHAINYEMAVTPADFLIRRTPIILQDKENGEGCLSVVSERMAEVFNWSSEQKIRYETEYQHAVGLQRKWQD